MTRPDTRIETQRLILRNWRDADLANFTRLHTDPRAMRDYGTPISPAQSQDKFDRFRAHYTTHGYIRWRVDSKAGAFLGYAGLYHNGADHPLGAHSDIGWRFLPETWGHGYATEAAQAALTHAFAHHDLTRIFAYTAADNLASQAVIARLGFKRDPCCDFTIQDDIAGTWHGMTWIAEACNYPLGGME